jgi:hypothetical protein
MAIQRFYGKGQHTLLWCGSRTARGNIQRNITIYIQQDATFTQFMYIWKLL